MKRLVILAAAVFTLASCAKTQVVYNEEPQEIAFKTVSGVMTKGPLDTGKDLGVFAELYDNSTDGELYFGNSLFTYNTDSWKGNKYWPISNGLIFTVYSPYINDNEKASWNTGTNTLTLELVDNTTNQTDLLYGMTRPTGNRNSPALPVELGHALAQVTINVSAKTNSIVTLKSLAINNTVQSGTCSVVYGATPTVSWPALGSVVDSKTLTNSETELTVSGITITYLVVPSTITDQTLTLTYVLAGSSQPLTYTTIATPNALGTSWNHGKNYIYNITIDPKQIEFNATVAEWDDDTDGDGDDNETPIGI